MAMALLVAACSKDTKNDTDSGQGGGTSGGGEKSIKSIMVKMHSPKGVLQQVKADLDRPDTDWSAVQGLTKEYRDGAETVASQEPRKGDKESWNKLCGEYIANAKALDDAAIGKDKEKCKSAETKLQAGCRSCHAAHKGGRG
jgi:hypothetical protein